MSPVGVMIDEADAFLGGQGPGRGLGQSNRVFAQIASFMGNTEFRGKIIWFLITCRPDLLPIDLKRQGTGGGAPRPVLSRDRRGEGRPLRDPREKLDLRSGKPRRRSCSEIQYEFSGADLESVLIRAKFQSAMNGHVFVTKEDLDETMADFVPPAYPHEIELQNLVAVSNARQGDGAAPPAEPQPDKLVNDIQQLKSLLGEGPLG